MYKALHLYGEQVKISILGWPIILTINILLESSQAKTPLQGLKSNEDNLQTFWPNSSYGYVLTQTLLITTCSIQPL
jgi:hypothetical protein